MLEEESVHPELDDFMNKAGSRFRALDATRAATSYNVRFLGSSRLSLLPETSSKVAGGGDADDEEVRIHYYCT